MAKQKQLRARERLAAEKNGVEFERTVLTGRRHQTPTAYSIRFYAGAFEVLRHTPGARPTFVSRHTLEQEAEKKVAELMGGNQS